jgi:hypothetical protein
MSLTDYFETTEGTGVLATFTFVMAGHSPFLKPCISRYLNIH